LVVYSYDFGSVDVNEAAAVISRHDFDVVINPRVNCWKLCVIFGSACKENSSFAWLESMIFIFSDLGL
jgi:hypothetical protein